MYYYSASGNMAAQPSPTPSELRLQGFEQRKLLKSNSLLSKTNPENIGPSIFSCRITDLDVNPADPTELYVAYASADFGTVRVMAQNSNRYLTTRPA
jgi:hypothetical protein